MRSLLVVLAAAAGSLAPAGRAEAGAVDNAKAAAAKLKAAVVKKFESKVRRPTVVVAVRGERLGPAGPSPQNYGVEVWIIPASRKRYCHREWCRQLRAVPPGRREGFFWLGDACDAGYRPCPVCRTRASSPSPGRIPARS